MNMKTSSETKKTCIICGNIIDVSKSELFDTRFGISNTYSIALCSFCGLEQTIPAPSPEEIKSLYETYYNFGGEQNTIYTRLRSLFLSSWIYRLWMVLDGDMSFHSARGTGRLIDVGCNEGRGLAIYQRNGFVAEGLELNETAANMARSQGFKVYTQLLEHFEQPYPYDVVVLSNVLEHSIDPKGMISHVYRILKPRGEVWISCPNNRSWLRTLFAKYWINWHVPFHISHFSPNTLCKLMQDSGFSVTKVKQETPALWVSHSIIARLFAKQGKPTKQLRNPVIVLSLMMVARGLLFPILWLGNRLGRGDCLVITARKR